MHSNLAVHHAHVRRYAASCLQRFEYLGYQACERRVKPAVHPSLCVSCCAFCKEPGKGQIAPFSLVLGEFLPTVEFRKADVAPSIALRECPWRPATVCRLLLPLPPLPPLPPPLALPPEDPECDQRGEAQGEEGSELTRGRLIPSGSMLAVAQTPDPPPSRYSQPPMLTTPREPATSKSISGCVGPRR